MPHDRQPDGFFYKDFIVYHDGLKSACVTRGFRFRPPNLSGASNTLKAEMHDRLCNYLKQISPDVRVQWKWRTNCNYEHALNSYDEVTSKYDVPAIVEHRKRHSRKLWKMMRERQLRREELYLFITTKIALSTPAIKGREALAQHFETTINELNSAYQQYQNQLRGIFGSEVLIETMNDFEHFQLTWRVANPSADNLPEEEMRNAFDPEASIEENCLHSDIVGQSKYGLYLDNRYCSVITIKSLGRGTNPGLIDNLICLRQLDYEITVNLTPIDTQKEIDKEQKEYDRLGAEQKDKYKIQKETAMDVKEAKVKRLSKGDLCAFRMTYMVRIWAQNEAALTTAMSSVKTAMGKMHGVKYYENALPASTLKLFYATWPGWNFSSYDSREIYIENNHLANIIPFSSSFNGDLRNAEALYTGTRGELVGVAGFARNGDYKTPLHAFVAGTTGSGKSESLSDQLLQSAPFYGYDVILEEGNSYKAYPAAFGIKSIVLSPNSNYTINPFSTSGLIIDNNFYGLANGLMLHMIGTTDPNEAAMRLPKLQRYTKELCRNAFEDFCLRNRTLKRDILREAYAAHRWMNERMDNESSYMDASLVIKRGLKAGIDDILKFVAEVDEQDAIRFSKAPDTSDQFAHYGFSFMTENDYPKLPAMVDLMTAEPMKGHDKGEITFFADSLSNWTKSGGQYGALFDGNTNISLTGRVVHIELANIPDTQATLKSAIALLITSIVRNHIITLPRVMQKRVVYEELMRFINVPGADRLIKESYQQLRKYNTQAYTVFQQLAQLKETSVYKPVLDNSKLFYLLRSSPDDLADLVKDKSLPESLRNDIIRYELIEGQQPGKMYSSICYHNTAMTPMVSGTFHHIKPAA